MLQDITMYKILFFSRKRVGEVFIEYKERFLKYGEYCAQLPRALQLLESLCAK
jgi:hypothetical protein